MTTNQERFYWRLWGMARKADATLDRKALHAELGLPESHGLFNDEHFDKWKAHCLALSQPGNYKAQFEQVVMPATRKRHFVGFLLSALDRPEEYAEAILSTMNRRGKIGGKLRTLDSLGEDDVKKVLIALKKECRRTWPTKGDLLGAIYELLAAHGYLPSDVYSSVAGALNIPEGRPLVPQKMVYESLLVVLGAIRRLADQGFVPERLAPTADELEAVDVPF